MIIASGIELAGNWSCNRSYRYLAHKTGWQLHTPKDAVIIGLPHGSMYARATCSLPDDNAVKVPGSSLELQIRLRG